MGATREDLNTSQHSNRSRISSLTSNDQVNMTQQAAGTPIWNANKSSILKDGPWTDKTFNAGHSRTNNKREDYAREKDQLCIVTIDDNQPAQS